MKTLATQTVVTLEEQARERLREDILGGTLLPGSRLRIRELVLRYQIGSSPLREALSRLVSEELVELEGNKGFRVAPLSIQELCEVTEMRQLLEGHALSRSIERGGDEWESRIVAALHHLRRACTAPLGDEVAQRVRWEEAHSGFHLALSSSCGSEYLLRSIARLYQVLVRYRALLQVNDLAPARLVAIHDALAKAALGRDIAAAQAILPTHVQVNIAQVTENVHLHPELLGEPS